MLGREEGDMIICPWCGKPSEAQRSKDDCQLVIPPILDPPTGTVEAMATLMEMMHSQVGIPPAMMGIEYTPHTYVYHRSRPVEEDEAPTVQKALYEYLKSPDLLDDCWSCGGERPSIRVQAERMGMRVFNNRKRMRKRVRQRRRHFDPYEEHWTNNPNGDW